MSKNICRENDNFQALPFLSLIFKIISNNFGNKLLQTIIYNINKYTFGNLNNIDNGKITLIAKINIVIFMESI